MTQNANPAMPITTYESQPRNPAMPQTYAMFSFSESNQESRNSMPLESYQQQKNSYPGNVTMGKNAHDQHSAQP